MFLGKELYACPICFAHLVGSPESDMLHAKHPVDVLMSSGSSFAERVERGAGVCFTSLTDVVNHACFEHKLPQARSRRFSSLFSRFRVRATDGLLQMHVYACGGASRPRRQRVVGRQVRQFSRLSRLFWHHRSRVHRTEAFSVPPAEASSCKRARDRALGSADRLSRVWRVVFVFVGAVTCAVAGTITIAVAGTKTRFNVVQANDGE